MRRFTSPWLAAAHAELRKRLGGIDVREIGRRATPISALLLVLVTSTGLSRPPAAHGRPLADPHARASAIRNLEKLESRRPLHLQPATTAPAPLAVAPPDPLRAKEIFGFAPYWTLDSTLAFDYAHLTTIAYFGVDVNPDGSISRSGDSWAGYQSQQLVDMIDRAHKAGVKVVLTAKNFDAASLQSLISDPGAPARLSGELEALAGAKSMDGVNLDFEGTDPGGRAGFATFATSVARTLKQAHPGWQLTIDTYGSSAGNPMSWFDIPALAPAFDAIFVMGYDMFNPDSASPNASLAADREYMANYAGDVAPSKVILGVPFYGYDWPTKDQHPESKSTGEPQPITWAQLVTSGHPPYWDPNNAVPWTAYQAAGQWHEVYYDDPLSIALKARLAADDKLRGIGAWALGMDGNDPAMQAALLGQADGGSYGSGPSGPAPSPSPTPPSSHPTPSPSPGASPPAPQVSPSPGPPGPPGGILPSPQPQPSPSPCPSPSPVAPGLPPPPPLC